MTAVRQLCLACADRKNGRRNAQRARARAARQCPTCGAEVQRFVYCMEYRQAANDRAKRRARARRREESA